MPAFGFRRVMRRLESKSVSGALLLCPANSVRLRDCRCSGQQLFGYFLVRHGESAAALLAAAGRQSNPRALRDEPTFLSLPCRYPSSPLARSKNERERQMTGLAKSGGSG